MFTLHYGKVILNADFITGAQLLMVLFNQINGSQVLLLNI